MEVPEASASEEVTLLEDTAIEKSTSNHSADIKVEMGKTKKRSEAQKANRSQKNKQAKARDETAKAAKEVSVPETLAPAQHDHFQLARTFQPQVSTATLLTVMEDRAESTISYEPTMNIRNSLPFRNDTVDGPIGDESPVDFTSAKKSSPNSTEISTGPASSKYSPTSNSSSTKSTSKSKSLKTPATDRSGFDQYLNDLKCRRLGCDRMTNTFDGSTVICPKCGPKSLVRYCSLNCLLDPDIRRHFHEECSATPIPTNRTIDSITLNPNPFNMRPFIHCAFDTTERHRQAVYHSSNVLGGDYFIFDDLWVADNTSLEGGGRGQVIAVCMFADSPNPFSPKKRFQMALEDCLREGYLRHELVIGLVWMIVAWLTDVGQWSCTSNIAKELANQIFREFSCMIPEITLDGFAGTTQSSEAFCET